MTVATASETDKQTQIPLEDMEQDTLAAYVPFILPEAIQTGIEHAVRSLLENQELIAALNDLDDEQLNQVVDSLFDGLSVDIDLDWMSSEDQLITAYFLGQFWRGGQVALRKQLAMPEAETGQTPFLESGEGSAQVLS